MTRQRMTICCIDLERFNFASRHLPLETVGEFIQGLYERIGDVLLAHGGRLVKYMGDGGLVAFTAAHEEIAVRAMWTLRETYREYADAAATDLHATALAAGIATGEVLAGQIGHPQMLSFDVLGKPVTVAEALVRCGGIAVDEATFEAVQGRISALPITQGTDSRGHRVTGFH